MEWSRYGTREISHEEEISSYKKWEMAKESWQEEGSRMEK